MIYDLGLYELWGDNRWIGSGHYTARSDTDLWTDDCRIGYVLGKWRLRRGVQGSTQGVSGSWHSRNIPVAIHFFVAQNPMLLDRA